MALEVRDQDVPWIITLALGVVAAVGVAWYLSTQTQNLGPAIVVSPDSITQGQAFTIEGLNFSPGIAIVLNVGNNAILGGLTINLSAGSDGSFSRPVTTAESANLTQRGTIPVSATAGGVTVSTTMVVN